ncbi:small heat shock protein [Gracilibacillus halophilus YIM-C55.5]|uniref:Small heat shock protein n=1 Tax=Gracilibacillus halophilus YIM-C55.5 TaxID=1308866 RepID=N4WKR1_9BACI|nr:Hsp20/alpha crystallin family protein [Gracilibacillus halophilus]ENH96757.1 small heat shock protein [Gracilibacillus halophilus YIM-C55.5]
MDPFQHMHDWKHNLDHFFGGDFWNEFDQIVKPPLPAVNLYELENEIICYINLPGIKNSKQIKLYVDDDQLDIKGELFPIEQSGKLIKQEILHGDFSRQIDLPFPVRKDRVQATLKNGLMTVHLHRRMHKQQHKKRIDINELEDE